MLQAAVNSSSWESGAMVFLFIMIFVALFIIRIKMWRLLFNHSLVQIQKLDNDTFGHMMALIKEVVAHRGYFPTSQQENFYTFTFERMNAGGRRKVVTLTFTEQDDHVTMKIEPAMGIRDDLRKALRPYFYRR